MSEKAATYEDRFWTSPDGLKLHYRDFPGRSDRPPVVCLPGLTRNARDFESLASRLSGDWRVLCLDLRGRGDSAYAKDASSYDAAHYVADIMALLDDQGIDRFISVGTSLGALLTMQLAMIMPDRIAGAVLNDAGPVIDVTGLMRIRSYIGQGRSFPTWMHAARAQQDAHRKAHPDFAVEDWLRMAKQVMTVAGNGRIVFDYDMKIAEPFLKMDPHNLPDLWAGLDALRGKPLLLVRGGLSDLLTAATLAEMMQRAPGCDAVTLPRVGHAPTLAEPEVVGAIDRMLGTVA